MKCALQNCRDTPLDTDVHTISTRRPAPIIQLPDRGPLSILSARIGLEAHCTGLVWRYRWLPRSRQIVTQRQIILHFQDRRGNNQSPKVLCLWIPLTWFTKCSRKLDLLGGRGVPPGGDSYLKERRGAEGRNDAMLCPRKGVVSYEIWSYI